MCPTCRMPSRRGALMHVRQICVHACMHATMWMDMRVRSWFVGLICPMRITPEGDARPDEDLCMQERQPNVLCTRFWVGCRTPSQTSELGIPTRRHKQLPEYTLVLCKSLQARKPQGEEKGNAQGCTQNAHEGSSTQAPGAQLVHIVALRIQGKVRCRCNRWRR